MGRHLYVDARGNVYYIDSRNRRIAFTGSSRSDFVRDIQNIFRNDAGPLETIEYDPQFLKEASESRVVSQRARERIATFEQAWHDLLSQGATPEGPRSSGATPEGPRSSGATPEGPRSSGATPQGYQTGGTTKGGFTKTKVRERVEYIIREIKERPQSITKVVNNIYNWYVKQGEEPSDAEIDNVIIDEIEKDPKKPGGKTEQPPKEPKKDPTRTKPGEQKKPDPKKKDPIPKSSGAYLPTHSRTYGYHNVTVAEISKLKTPSARETWFPQSSDVEAAWTAQVIGKPYYWKPPPARDILKRSTPGTTPGGTSETTTGETPTAYGNARALLTSQ